MENKEEIINRLKEFFTRDGVGAEADPIPLYHEVFKPLIDPKYVNFFIELFDSGNMVLRAWGFLGIFKLLFRCLLNEKEDEIKNIISITELQRIIGELLKDKRDVADYGGCFVVSHGKMNEFFVDDICLLPFDIISEQVLEYCIAEDTKTDIVVGKLLEQVLSQSTNSEIESLFIKHAKRVENTDFKTAEQIVKAFGNLCKKNGVVINKKEVKSIFRDFLQNIEQDQSESLKIKGENEYQRQKRIDNIKIGKKNLLTSIIRSAAIIGLDFKDETIEYIKKYDG